MAGSQGSSSAVFWSVAAAVVLLSCWGASAVTFEVGGAGAGGWKIPDATNKLNYTSWAAKNKFRVGDVLHFTYINRAHNVLPLPTLVAYTNCDFSGANLSSLLTGGSSSVPLTTTGPAYYVCQVPGHCLSRMKFQINVTAALAPAPAPVVTPPPALAPSPALPPATSPTTSESPPAPFEASSPEPATSDNTKPSSAPLSVVVSGSLAAIVMASTMLLSSLL